MTLYTNDYLEYYLTLVGWLVSNVTVRATHLPDAIG
ncbi:hypothetical protein BN1864_LIB5394:02942 [Pseudomonas sp. 1 R 17]|nr:hypothetical protein BN1864_LIB5394:02942 [Pseudomonas sp. 1 R 17]